jgi:enolase 1/2/3
MMNELVRNSQPTGDDVCAIQPKILAEGMNKGIANSVLTKLNQIGTGSEILKTVKLPKRQDILA